MIYNRIVLLTRESLKRTLLY